MKDDFDIAETLNYMAMEDQSGCRDHRWKTFQDAAAKINRLQKIIDSRPAINAGLPESYIEWSRSIYEMDAARISKVLRCCLTTPDPGAWKAGVDNTADQKMVNAMHKIRDLLSYQMPAQDLIWALRAEAQVDTRTMLGDDIQRCLLSNASHRLEALVEKIDPAPWNTLRNRIMDAWAIIRRRAVCVYVNPRK